jgi:hypothetical protein
MFLVAATTLADMVDTDRLTEGALYPSLAKLRPISRAVAIAVASEASASGAAPMMSRDQAAAAVDTAIWTPEYCPPRYADRTLGQPSPGHAEMGGDPPWDAWHPREVTRRLAAWTPGAQT